MQGIGDDLAGLGAIYFALNIFDKAEVVIASTCTSQEDDWGHG